ncbi:MAG: 30S ribosomal protein S9 [Chlamydiia bacterium]
MAAPQQELVATGRRKTAVASVRMRPGSGQILVNDRPFDVYFPVALTRNAILAPITKLKLDQRFDIICRTVGGGPNGQAESMRLAISRALVGEEPERRSDLKNAGFLTRDPRRRERKKYGLKGARKRFQFSKR